MGRLDEVLTRNETLALSAGTQSKRRIIHGFVWLTLACSGTLAGFAAFRLLTEADPNWHVLSPLAAWSVMFFGTLVYYLKWNDHWFREHADAEFAAKRYKADIVRASWLAELVSEWGEEGRNALPKELVEAYTRNLFRSTGPVRETEHPLGQMTGLLKNIKRIELDKGKLVVDGGAKGGE